MERPTYSLKTLQSGYLSASFSVLKTSSIPGIFALGERRLIKFRNMMRSLDNGFVVFQGRLVRLRTCHDKFMVQCELCEVIRIVNVSYAASPVHGCADLTFQQEFDCRLPAKSQYIAAITERCDGIQSCQLTRETSDVSCGHPSKTWSCCLEIYYTCEPSKWNKKFILRFMKLAHSLTNKRQLSQMLKATLDYFTRNPFTLETLLLVTCTL